MAIATVNPATGETLRTFDPLDQGEIDDRIGQAHQAFLDLRRTTFATRAGSHLPSSHICQARSAGPS